MRLLLAGHHGHVQGQFQGAERDQLELVAGAEHQGARSKARPVRERFPIPARSHPQLYPHPLPDGRAGAELLRSAHRNSHQFPVSSTGEIMIVRKDKAFRALVQWK